MTTPRASRVDRHLHHLHHHLHHHHLLIIIVVIVCVGGRSLSTATAQEAQKGHCKSELDHFIVAPTVKGLDGAKGDRGDVGPPGKAGPHGPPGLKGDVGASGHSGAKGDKGDACVCDGAEKQLAALQKQVDRLKSIFAVAASKESGKVHQLARAKLTYADARRHCRGLGGELAAPRSASDNEALRLVVPAGDYAYIGVDDTGSEGTFTYAGAGGGGPLGYNNWNTGEPNNAGGDEDCAIIVADGGKWNDIRCSRLCHFVCELPL
ncbi:mannose-binding protein A-like [Lampetra fluviatilis]